MLTLIWAFIVTVPNIILAIAGILLWRRHRSVPTAMVAAGFAAVALALIVSLSESIEYSSLVRAHPDASFIIGHYRPISQVIHFAGLAGLWAASIGLIWHVQRNR